MNIIKFPKRESWPEILQRPTQELESIKLSVQEIVTSIKRNKDKALFEYSKRFDGVNINNFLVTKDEIKAAHSKVPDELKQAISNAHTNIEIFHAHQSESSVKLETTSGVVCWRESIAIERVGIYIPAGSAPLFSTVLMLAIPAKLAGCDEVIMCSPPDKNGKINDIILYAADICGVTSIFKIGGAHAIASMAYGTESVPKVYKIFGPGNNFVTAAKMLVSNDVAIDMPAGPSEVAILADETCEPAFVAADLLAQAEHGADSQVILVTESEKILNDVIENIDIQVEKIPRKEIAKLSLKNSKAILVENRLQGMELLNEYAAEHLIIAVKNADEIAKKVKNAGSVFIGNYSCESAGDYATGTNHTLPTGGFARSFSGVSLDSFVKKITFQKLSDEGLKNIGPDVELMAAAEGLDAHKNAVSIRLETLK